MNDGFFGFPPAEAPYRIYVALLRQFGTDAPIATVLENTLELTPTWEYINIGLYRMWGSTLNFPLQFSTEKTFARISPTFNTGLNGGSFSPIYTELNYNNNMITHITIRNYDGDNYLYDTPIEIRVYN